MVTSVRLPVYYSADKLVVCLLVNLRCLTYMCCAPPLLTLSRYGGYGLLLNRRRNREIEERNWPSGTEAPYVEIIVPARNEEHNLPRYLARYSRRLTLRVAGASP